LHNLYNFLGGKLFLLYNYNNILTHGGISMKRTLLTGFSFILVLTLLLTATGSAIAAPLADGPVVKPLTGSDAFTTVTISPASLPGTTVNSVGTIVPAGFSTGEKQFDGDGIKVSGMMGSASACFPLAKYQFGWSGSVYQWVNGKWTVLPTTITPIAESANATACATIYADGIYALLVSYHEPAGSIGACSMRFLSGVVGDDTTPGELDMYGVLMLLQADAAKFHDGMTFKYKVINNDLSIPLSGDLSGYLTLFYVSGNSSSALLEFEFAEGTTITYSGEGMPNGSVRIYLGSCYLDVPLEMISGG
jgi:hypothetical protein